MNEKVSLIIPAAGQSKRFKGKPKWLLTCPNGNLMIQECIIGLDLSNVNNIYITFLKEHIDKYCKGCNIEELFVNTNCKIHILILDEATKSQTETVYKTIITHNILGPIFIKDCDNYYDFKVIKGNYVCSLLINNKCNVSCIYNKSFIEHNNLNQIINICEKQIISNKICVGGYSFESASILTDYYIKCVNLNLDFDELYISHIILQCILNNIIFFKKDVLNYIDWGTQKDWNIYCNTFKNIFIDIDGTLLFNSSQYFSPKWGESKPIYENIKHIQNLYRNKRTKIILTTSRKYKYKEITEKQLKKYDNPYDDIIFNLYHSKRYLINDYANTNPYPTAIAINLKRNSNELEKILN